LWRALVGLVINSVAASGSAGWTLVMHNLIVDDEHMLTVSTSLDTLST
jgi:hypothetical protein